MEQWERDEIHRMGQESLECIAAQIQQRAKLQEDADRQDRIASNTRKWHYRFLEMAALIATWSKELNTRVGCVIVDNKRRVIATGYNGFPRGVIDDLEVINDPAYRDQKLAMTLHAEENALLVAGRNAEGCTAYITHPPCSLCMARLIQSGIKRVIYSKLVDDSFKDRWSESVNKSYVMARQSGVELAEFMIDVPREPLV